MSPVQIHVCNDLGRRGLTPVLACRHGYSIIIGPARPVTSERVSVQSTMNLRWLKSHPPSRLTTCRGSGLRRPSGSAPVDLAMVCQAVGQPRSVVAIQHCGALTVEVRGSFVGIEFVEYRWQRSSPKMLGRNGIAS